MLKKTLLYILLTSFMGSCVLDKKDFDFKIINHTPFRISSIKFNDTIYKFSNNDTLILNDVSVLLNCICPAEPLLDIMVLEYKDSNDIYKNIFGRFLDKEKLSEIQFNIIIIDTVNIYEDDIFKYELIQ